MNHFSPRPVIDPATERRAGEVLQPPLPRIDDIDLDDIQDHRLFARVNAIWALFLAYLALVAVAIAGFGIAFFFLFALGTAYSFRAIAHTRRADSILQRSLAASLVEEGPGILAEAA